MIFNFLFFTTKYSKNKKILVEGREISIILDNKQEFISLTDMLKAKDGDFFISDWLRNRNTVEYLGIWESVYNPDFNYGEFAIIKCQAGINSYKLSVKEWVEKTKIDGRETNIPPISPMDKWELSALKKTNVFFDRIEGID